MKNKRGKVVSKRASAHGKRAYRNVEDWVDAVMEARQMLHVKGFCAINGRTLQGKSLYLRAKTLRVSSRVTRVSPLPSVAVTASTQPAPATSPKKTLDSLESR